MGAVLDSLFLSAFVFRHFRLYLTTNTELFTDDFKAVVMGESGMEELIEVPRQNFFTGHVIGKYHTCSVSLLIEKPVVS